MPCYKPLKAYQHSSGGKPIFTKPRWYEDYNPLTLPCGRCIGCRLERSRQWAMRCVHESSMWHENSFITLTYNNESLPANGSLDKTHYQLFMKRLRKKFKSNENNPIRFYMCGEYGDISNRPHYHAILFNHDFHDKSWHKTIKGNKLYVSDQLQDIWKHGHCLIGDVTFESAAYVARYLMKKQNGKALEIIDPKTHLKPYEVLDHHTGQISKILPEYTTMSLKPGIAHNWIKKHWKDVYPSDNIHIRGKELKPCKSYDLYIKRMDTSLFDSVKEKRILQMHNHMHDNTPERLATKEIVKQAQLNKLIRPSI